MALYRRAGRGGCHCGNKRIPDGKKVQDAYHGVAFRLSNPPRPHPAADDSLWIAIVGMAFGIVFGKMVFGGFGKNIFNPAITARAFIYISFGVPMTSKFVANHAGFPGGFASWLSVDVISAATPLVARDTGLLNLFWDSTAVHSARPAPCSSSSAGCTSSTRKVRTGRSSFPLLSGSWPSRASCSSVEYRW